MANRSSVLQPEAYEAQLRENATLGWTAADIRNANRNTLLSMQHRLGLGDEWGRIEFPKAFMPSGGAQRDCRRILKLDSFMPNGVSPDESSANDAWVEIIRFTVARLSLPSPRRSVISKYSTCCGDLHFLKMPVRKIMERSSAEGHFWSRVGEEPSTSKSPQIFSVVRHYHHVGALPDAFSRISTIEADEPERDRTGEPEHVVPVDKNRQWQPLPMEFVAEMGWRSLRLIKSVAPTLFDALELAVEHWPTPLGINGQPIKEDKVINQTREGRDSVIAQWQWLDENGLLITDLGFEFNLKNRSSGIQIQWPPSTFGQAMRLAHSLVKPAHLWMVLLGNGPRNSEAVAMRNDCLVPATNGNFRVKGRTFKMSGLNGGRETEVVVPEIIGQSILQQMRMARIVNLDKGLKSNALWIGETKPAVLNLSEMLNSYARTLGQRHLLGEENPTCHEHRFRKTLARLVAVALTNSIMILKDCFGHADAVMTLLSYITSDPMIAQEVIKIQKELSIVMAVDVINDREAVGGPAAGPLRQRTEEFLKRIGKSKLEPQDAYEFARRETFDGRSWMMIAPGILCTAPHDVTQVSTPCAKGVNRHNPASCKTACDWQLLLKGYYVTQADDSVEYSLKNLQDAIDVDDEASIAFWAGQAKAWLYRYDEVSEKWKDHPLVMAHAQRPRKIVKVTA